jgi:hypothetical protein
MMRFGSIGVAAVALFGVVLVATSTPASARLPAPAAPRDVSVDVELATELPAPVAPVVAAPATPAPRQVVRASSMRAAQRVPATEEGVDELSDEPTVVVPIDGPRPNPF